nr:MAG: replicative DNA helicase [Pseudomonadota bacterium]
MASVERLPTALHSLDAEQAVLGSILLEPQAWALIAGKVTDADFYRPEHRILFAAIARRAFAGESIEPIAVLEDLDRAGQLAKCGGRDYIASLIERVVSPKNVEAYAAVVRDYSTLRRLRRTGEEIVRLVDKQGTRSAADLVADASRMVAALTERARTAYGLIDAETLAREFFDDLDRRRDGDTGLMLGLPDFDRLTNGLEAGDLVVLAGRPGMGKTALLVSIAAHVSRDRGVAVFSAEMPKEQLMRRCVSLLATVDQARLRRASMLTDDEWAAVGEAIVKIGRRHLWIDEYPSPPLAHIRAESLALASRVELALVMVDYAQLVRGEGHNRYEQLRDVAYGLKDLAKELRVPVIALAQLNRDVERREDKRPRMADLRDSGAIEEAADIIGLLYREGYYDPSFHMPYVLECQIEKNRNGELGECLWHFSGPYSRVFTLDRISAEDYRRERAQRGRAARQSPEVDF